MHTLDTEATTDTITIVSQSNSIHALCKNINSITMPMHDVLLCHFRKMLLYTRVYMVAHSYLLCTLAIANYQFLITGLAQKYCT